MQMLLGAAVCLMKRERKEPAATAKTFLPPGPRTQDSTQERGARLNQHPLVRSRSQICLYLGTCRLLLRYLLAELGTTRAQRQPFLGSAGRGETWARFKRTEPQMAWDVS